MLTRAVAAVLVAAAFVLVVAVLHTGRTWTPTVRTAHRHAGGAPGWVSVAWADAYGAAADAEVERLAIEAAKAEAARVAAEEAARWAVIEARWITVGRCEQPSTSGWQGVAWDTVSSIYSGGLGISNAAWREWGGLEFAPNGGLAAPAQQMIVAERIMAEAGRRAWGCPVP